MLSLVAILASGCAQSSTVLSAGDRTAPDFSGVDSEQQALSLRDLLATRPVIVHFIEIHCACSRQAAVHVQRLQDAYGQSVSVIGIINAHPEDAKRWRREAGVSFTVIADPWCEIVRSYGVERSVHTVLVNRMGRVAAIHPRYSIASLNELNTQVATLLSIPTRFISTEGAPVKPTAGCTFPE